MGHSTHSHSYSNSIGAQELQNAFQTFNQLSEELISSYAELQSRVAGLNSELADTRKEKMYELAEKERIADRLSTILNALPAAIVVLDRSGIIQETNPSADQLFRDCVVAKKLVGLRWVDVIGCAFAPRSDDGHDISLTDGRRVNITTNALESDTGQILLIKDVTQSRELTEQLNRFQKMTAMSEMASGLAHQIRTPLATSMLYASHLKQTELLAENRFQLVDKVQSQMRHIEKLVNDMLMFARGDVVGNQPFLLSELMTDLHTLTQSEIKNNNVNLSINNEMIDKKAMLAGSKDVLLSGLQNIISNAIQSFHGADYFHGSDESRQITICVNQVEANIIDIRVRDNGKGISKEQQQRILEPFFTTRSRGTGLGLSVVETIAKSHNGYLWFESLEGEGSTFALRLPFTNAFTNALTNEESSKKSNKEPIDKSDNEPAKEEVEK